MDEVLSLLALAATLAVAQQTRKEVDKATTPAQSSNPTSADVPDAYAITGQFEKVVILRFEYQADLLAGWRRW